MTARFFHRFVCVATGFGALLATSFAFHALLSPSIPEGVSEKFEFFTRHKDEFDTLFLGTSRFYYAVSPKIFDDITRENGVPTRTFNFGVDGMHAGLIRSSPPPMVAPPGSLSYLFRRTTRRLFIFSSSNRQGRFSEASDLFLIFACA